MTFEYLSVDDLIRINAAQEGGVGVQSMDGVEANAARPQSGFGGHDKFPDVWTKAAAYAHGIASTQYFTDGNKRTGWLVANIFLKAHGVALPKVDDIAAEAFINAVALDAWKADGDDATVLKAAEWFRTTYEHQRRGVVSDHRVEYAYLAEEATLGDGIVHFVRFGGITSIGSPTFPIVFPITLIARVHWGQQESADPPVVCATMSVTSGAFTGLILGQVALVPDEFARSGHEHHRTGWMPTLLQFILVPTFHESATAEISLTIGDDEVAVIPFAAHLTTEVPDHI